MRRRVSVKDSRFSSPCRPTQVIAEKGENEWMTKPFGTAAGISRTIAVVVLTIFIISIPFNLQIEKMNPGRNVFIARAMSLDGLSNATIHYLDVGMGDCMFIETSCTNVLIDGGLSSAAQAVLNYLEGLNVTRIHLMIATHPHEDHLGGLVAVLNSSITVDQVLFNNDTVPSPIPWNCAGYAEFLSLAESHNLTVAYRGQVFQLADDVSLTVLNPTQPLEFTWQLWVDHTVLNDNGIVVKLQAGNASFLFAGDASAAAEQSMENAGLDLQSDVLKVGWHGYAGATTDSFLDLVAPSYAVIAACWPNKYGEFSPLCPYPGTVDKLLARNITVLETQAHGTIVASTNGDEITVHVSRMPSSLVSSISPVSASIFLKQSVTFSSTTGGGTPPYRYQWHLNETPVSETPELYMESWTTTLQSIGNWTVYLKIRDNLGNTAQSNPVLVTVIPRLRASIACNSTSIHVNESLIFNSTISGDAPPFSYQWYLNESPVLNATSASWNFEPATNGTFAIHLEIADTENHTVQSDIAYIDVTADTVPEYSKLFIIALSLTATVLAVILCRREESRNQNSSVQPRREKGNSGMSLSLILARLSKLCQVDEAVS